MAGTVATARSADGVPIRFDTTGAGEPTLLFVHGWAVDRRIWDDEAKRLSARQRVVTLDLAGHGDSGGERSEWTMRAFGQDVKAVAEAADATRIVLVGHSMGGAVVLEAARLMPQRVEGIVLVDMFLDVGTRTPVDQAEAMARKIAADYTSSVTQMVTEYLFAPTTPAAVRERVLRHVTALAPEVSTAMLLQTWTYDPLPALAEIKVPVRAVSADKYPTNVEGNRRYMPGYEAEIVAGSGHYPMLEDPRAFAAAMDRVLAQIARTKH